MQSSRSEEPIVRTASLGDAESIAHIYNYYVLNTVVTFEEEVVSTTEMAKRVDEVLSTSHPWLVAEIDGRVVGYAYGSKWKARSGYRFSTEISVYLDPGHGGRGLGSKLYDELFRMLRDRKMHAVIGGIALPNDASVALHEKFGMEKVAHFKQTGFKFDRWIDVGYWERTL